MKKLFLTGYNNTAYSLRLDTVIQVPPDILDMVSLSILHPKHRLQSDTNREM